MHLIRKNEKCKYKRRNIPKNVRNYGKNPWRHAQVEVGRNLPRSREKREV